MACHVAGSGGWFDWRLRPKTTPLHVRLELVQIKVAQDVVMELEGTAIVRMARLNFAAFPVGFAASSFQRSAVVAALILRTLASGVQHHVAGEQYARFEHQFSHTVGARNHTCQLDSTRGVLDSGVGKSRGLLALATRACTATVRLELLLFAHATEAAACMRGGGGGGCVDRVYRPARLDARPNRRENRGEGGGADTRRCKAYTRACVCSAC